MADSFDREDLAQALVVLERIVAAVAAGELEVSAGLAGGLGSAIELLRVLHQTDV